MPAIAPDSHATGQVGHSPFPGTARRHLAARGVVSCAAMAACVVVVLSALPARALAQGEDAPAAAEAAAPTNRTIGVVNQVGPAYPEPLQEAFETALEGLKSSAPDDVFVESLNGDSKRWPKVKDKLAKRSPGVWMAVGPMSLKILATSTADPVFFMMVATPEDSLPAGTPANVAGVTLRLAAADQLREIKKLLPAAKKVGVLHDPANARSQRELATARAAASELEMAIVDRGLKDQGDLGAAVQELLGKGIDVMWLIGDKKVTPTSDEKAFKFIVQKSAAKSVPVVGHVRRHTVGGALFSLGPDLKDIGLQAGELIARLGGGVTPADIGIVSPRKVSLTVNKKVARSLRIQLPAEALARAESVD